MSHEPKISPFDESYPIHPPIPGPPSRPLTLNRKNVELVLKDLRPYLQSDGGDVRLVSIRDGVVLLELIGACGSCASSAMTMKMGLEKRLMERIPSIRQVVQSELEAPPIDTEEVEKVLDGVRPFLKVAGGSLELMSISEVGDINLKMSGLAATLQSVRTEIAQRIQRHFKRSVRVQWL